MNTKIINTLMFAAGAAIGSAVTWKIVKDKYERIVQEEIVSIKEAFADSHNDDQEHDESSEDDVPDECNDRPECYGQINWDELEDLNADELEEPYTRTVEDDVKEYEHLISNYTNEKGGADIMSREPYVISPDDFASLDGYHIVELTYYLDGVLEDDEYHIVTDADELIGPKALTTFGEYEDDAVFVRNERLRTDFQILMEYRTYDEAKTVGPKQVDNE